MQLVIGNFFCPVNGAEVTGSSRAVLASSGRVVRKVSQVRAKVWLAADGQAACVAAETALAAALLVPYQSISLLTDAGRATGLTLLNGASISGCRVVEGPNFENDARDGEYVTQRTASFVVEAEFVVPGTQTAAISFTESISISGTGGPVVRWRPLINAPPVSQIIYPASTVKATQSGQAVGHLGYPTVPDPLFPAFELVDQRRIVTGSPKRLGQGFIEYPINWSYSFEGLGPLVAVPNLPPL